MMVEALWRNLKRITLHGYNRPPLDLMAYVLITRSIYFYRLTLAKLLISRGGGRPEQLTHMQVAFKRAWERLLTVHIKGTYETRLDTWTCNCGAQKYHAYLLCKHLVHVASPRPAIWWQAVVRSPSPPFFNVITGQSLSAPSVQEMRRGWLLKTAEASDDSDVEVVCMSDTFDSFDSSPSKPPPTGSDGLMRLGAGAGAGFELEDGEEHGYRDLARKLRFAADVLDDQNEKGASRFLKNAKRVLRLAEQWADDVEHHVNRRTMPKTNSKEAANVIGYLY